MERHIDEWVTHVSTWLKRKPTAIVRYEDLKVNPQVTLNQLFTRLNVEVSSNIIEQALHIFNFKQLAQRQEGEEDRSSFFRKGIVGDWQNHFSAEDLNFFNQKASQIMKQLEYD